MRIAILGPIDTPLGFMDNGVASALHFYDDTLHLYLAGNAYTYTFKCLTTKESLELLQVGNKLSFTYNGNGYYLNIITVDYDEYEMDISCTGLSFELLNEQVDKYEASSAMTLVQYLEATGTEVSHFPVVVNEVSDKSIKNKWDGRDTLLKRIFSLCNVFDCEVSFDARLNPDYSLNQVEMSFKRQLGSDRTGEILRYGKDITSISKKSDITDLYTAIRPIGKDGLTLQGYTHDKESDGCYVSGVNILNPDARDRFPAFVVGDDDAYIARYWDYDTDSQAELYGHALAELRKNSIPKVSYEVDGYVDASIGDRFTIEDSEYKPTLYVEARVVEQEICFTDQTKCKTTFDNFTEVKAELSDDIMQQVQVLVDKYKTYTCSIRTTGGTAFKSDTDSTTLTAHVEDENGLDITDDFDIAWTKDGEALATTMSVQVTGADISSSSVYRFTASRDGQIRGSAECTVMRVDDPAFKQEVNDQLKQNADNIDSAMDLITKNDEETKAEFEELHRYARYADGVLEFGAEENGIKLKLQNDRISFLQDGHEVAYISDQRLHITDGNFVHSLRVGNFAFIPRENGSLDFKKVS